MDTNDLLLFPKKKKKMETRKSLAQTSIFKTDICNWP